jgi:CRP/FNR family transcriptional regulator, cyclic AMP receptor protein
MNENLPNLLMAAVPIFQGFEAPDIQKVVSICHIRNFREHEILVESGSESTEMMLILSGTLLVKTARDIPLAQLFCPETIGEMGLLTGARRSATVEGVEPGSVAVMTQDELMGILESNTKLAAQFYKNVVEVLSIRLKNENFLIQMLREHVEDVETQLAIFESTQPSAPEKPELEKEDDVITAFYKRIGNPDMSETQRKRDQASYEDLRKQGYSEAQVRQTANWAAKNVRGLKTFGLIKHCIQEALR